MTSPISPFSESQWQQVQQLLRTLDERQTRWLSGYLAGGEPSPASGPAPQDSAVLIAYGGETGNCEGLARQLADQARNAGVTVDVEDLARLRVRQLGKRKHLLLICSTHGDGDPPEPAAPFHEALMADSAPRLEQMHFAVLALGDSTYEHFCATGQSFDRRLEELGARRLHSRLDCDVDFAEPAGQWMQAIVDKLPRGTAPGPVAAPGAVQQTDYSKQNPLTVTLLESVSLSAPGRESAIHHLELSLDVPGFRLEPGDAVGILPDNPPTLVTAVLDRCRLPATAIVSIDGKPLPLGKVLQRHRDLTIPSPRFLAYWAELSGNGMLLDQAATPAAEQRQFLKHVQLLDLLDQAPAIPEPQALVDVLRPLQPRLYDVANSLNAIGDELHLSVQAYHYPFGQRIEAGIASRYLLALESGDSVRVYPHRNARFHLPDDPDVPVILIGEGTGIAPYRAFLQEFERAGRGRPCWLVFAEHRFEEDFLYQTELQQARENDVLEIVDAVFYHDHPEASLATPLQTRVDTLQTWLGRGAHLYFCGDKERLTRCESALGNLLGAERWKTLDKDRRLHRNLY